MTAIDLDLFAGPGGWSTAARELGLPEVGIEWDRAACATRAAAGHRTIRADVSRFVITPALASLVRGLIGSPPCTTFSAAGDQAGNAVLELLAALIRDLFAGRDTRETCRKEMEAALTASEWAADLDEPKRAAKISSAVFSASLVAEPARFIAACRPEWVALEQVPGVLPLWQVYAAELRQMGYSAWTGKLNAADYGVPQTGERAILIASRVRQVARPEPTHYDDRRGPQLWGEPWIPMAAALGWGMTGRPYFTVATAGGNRGGADEQVGGSGARRALYAERDSGRWTLHTNRDQRADGTRQTADPYSAPAPALTSKSGGQWVLRTSFGKPVDDPKNGTHEMDPASRPAHAVTTKTGNWTLHRSRGSSCDADRRNHPLSEPAPTITSAGGKAGANLTWVEESGESVRLAVEEAAALQAFPRDYPWQGTRTARFQQVGNAVPPLLAIPVLGVATGTKWQPIAERYAETCRLVAADLTSAEGGEAA